MAAQHLVDPGTQIALPGGGQVSAQFLVEQGIYKSDPFTGKVIAPGDAHAVGYGGTTYQIAQHEDWFTPYAAAGSTPGEDPAAAARREAQANQNRQTSASVAAILRQYGLEELIPQVDTFIRGGMTWPEIEAMLRDPSSEVGKVFDAKFPEIRLRTEKGLQPLSVDEIQTYRTRAKQMFRSAGLPEGFYDSNEDFTNFIVGDVAITELEDRVVEGYARVMAAPVETRQALEQMYGVGTGALAAFFLDEQRALPVIQKQVAAAQIGGVATRTGFGSLAISEAERLAEIGVTDAQAEQGFGTLTASRELFSALDRGEDTIGRDVQLGAAFEGNAAAGERVSRRARRRQAQFSGGGGLATSREGGLSGLSTAN